MTGATVYGQISVIRGLGDSRASDSQGVALGWFVPPFQGGCRSTATPKKLRIALASAHSALSLKEHVSERVAHPLAGMVR